MERLFSFLLRLGIFCLFISTFLTSCFRERRSNKAGKKMQQFVENISEYARAKDSDFLIIPQNGPELSFNELDPESALSNEYLAAVDGFGMEEVFYNGESATDEYRLDMLRKLKDYKPILVSEYVQSESLIDDAYVKNEIEGFIGFVREPNNYDYTEISGVYQHENESDVLTLLDVKNYLYLISTDAFSSKESMVESIAATNYDLVIIDLFFEDNAFTSDDLARMKIKANGGKRLVIAYINIGAAEKYRYYWKKSWFRHHPTWLKRKYEGYDDEFWVKFWNKDWEEIIYGNDSSYIQKIIDTGFDGAYLDNVEAYYFLYYKD